MKKILLLLLFTAASYGQAVFDEGIQIKNNTTDNSATKVNVQSTDGTINTISKSDLVNVVEVNDVPSLPLIGEAGKIYVVKNLNKIYRWTGTFYQELTTDISGKEDIANKQNSLAVDGTNTKYPTVTAVNTGLALKANLASPALTGTPTAPTATVGTNTTQIATTAFVTGAISTADSGNVKLTGDQSIAGIKFFTSVISSIGGITVSNPTGFNFLANQSTGSNFNYVGQNSGTNTFTVNKFGATTATSFIKSSSPTTNILLAGGGDLAQGTAFNKNFGLNSGDVVGANTLLNQYSATPVDWTATAFNSGQVVFYGGKQWIAKIATVAGDVPAVSPKWEEITFEALANKTVSVDQTIIDGSTNAVSGNAVFDGLATKAPISSVHNPVTLGTANGLSLATQQLSLGLASSSTTGALSGTDWNTFNGKFNTPTGLTTNYLPKWNGSGFGNSQIIDNGTNVGVNETWFNLYGFGNYGGGVTSNLKFAVSDATYVNGFASVTNGSKLVFGYKNQLSSPDEMASIQMIAENSANNNEASSLRFFTKSGVVSTIADEKMRITPSGRVLINKTNDDLTNQLQVAGTISASPATTANQVVVKSQLDAVASSGSFTPSSSGGLVYDLCYWTKIGNVVTLSINAVYTAPTAGETVASIRYPAGLNDANPIISKERGVGSYGSNITDIKPCRILSTSTTQLALQIGPTTAGTYAVNAIMTYITN